MTDLIINEWYLLLLVLVILCIPSVIIWLFTRKYFLETFVMTFTLGQFLSNWDDFVYEGYGWG